MGIQDEDLLVKLAASVDRGANWLGSLQAPHGEFHGCGSDLAGYYKALLMFAISGRLGAGGRCLSYVKEKFASNSGELSSGTQKTSLTRMQRNLANYMNGWVAIGAWLLGDYQFSQRICALLKTQQGDSGGVLTGPLQWALKERYDLATAASCGRAFLLCGLRAEALAAADFLVEALKHQNAPDSLALTFNADWRPLATSDREEQTYYTFNPSQRGEKVWFPAFSAAFLCEANQVSENPAYVLAARKYYAFLSKTPEFADRTLDNGKSGWAAALLAQATGEERYREDFRFIMPNVLGRQGPDGEFGASARSHKPPGAGNPASQTPLPRRLEQTAEFTNWVAVYLRMLAARVLS
jgi:hypothetical protein